MAGTEGRLTVCHIFSGDLWAGAEVMMGQCHSSLKLRSDLSYGATQPRLPILSAGLGAEPGDAADVTALECAGGFGVDLSTHRARGVERRSLEEADVVFAMEVDHLLEIRRRFRDLHHRTYLLGCLALEGPSEVPDPVYGPHEMFQACFEQIERSVDGLVAMRCSGAAAGVGPSQPRQREELGGS